MVFLNGDEVVGLVVGLLGEQGLVDVGNDAATSDGSLDQDVQLLIAADGELEMPWLDGPLPQIPRSVSGQLKDLGGQVLKDGSHVDSSGGLNLLGSGVGITSLHLLQHARNAELESGSVGDGFPLLRCLCSSFGFVDDGVVLRVSDSLGVAFSILGGLLLARTTYNWLHDKGLLLLVRIKDLRSRLSLLGPSHLTCWIKYNYMVLICKNCMFDIMQDNFTGQTPE